MSGQKFFPYFDPCEDGIQSDDAQKWKLAVDEEMKSLELNDAFKLVDLPEQAPSGDFQHACGKMQA